jgi:universal stress protein A
MADEKIIVCATDLSEDSRHALDTAIELAAARGAKLLHVIHVRETTERFETVDEVATRADEQERALIEQVKQEVEHVRASRGRAVGVGIAIDVRYGNAYREILRYAADTKADTLVVGTHGRTGLRHALLGSVAERIARYAPCDVVVAKAPDVRAHLVRDLVGQER